MIMKKFQARTKEEAMEMAVRELGPDVVEMNTRSVKKKGPFGFLLPQQVELTVALEEEPVSRKESDISEAIAGVRKVAEAQVRAQEETPKVKSALQTLAEAQKRVDRRGAGIDLKTPDTPPERKITPDVPQNTGYARKTPAPAKNESSVIEEKLDSLHTMLEAQLKSTDEDSIREEDTSGTTIISGNARAGSADEESAREVEKFIKLLYNTMIDNEVNEKYANQIIDELEKTGSPNMPFEMALANTYQKMILKFGNPVGITPATKGPKIVFFIGPTGVGKTTTIAKIASKFSVEGGRKVALLTADTYRIAAAEQLRTYANILEIPFRIVYSAEEVEQSLKDFKDYDYVMVDTAGHSHQNESQREAMNGFIHSVDNLAEKEVFLVLSATTKYRDLLSIADTYSRMTEYKLIFTKLDETTTLGNLLNIKLHTGAPLSYVTCGQNVPDDIENFNPQKTVKQLLGGRK